MQSPFVYLDNNATTAVDDRVLETMLPYFKYQYANPNSPHLFGMQVQEQIEFAQQDLAHLVGCRPADLIFTSGATEAINLAIKGIQNKGRKHIVCASTEHEAVLDCCRFLENKDYDVTYLPVSADGLIDPDVLQASIHAETLLVCIMLVNNETGVIQDIQTIADIVHKTGAWLLCDATQAVGKIPIAVKKMGIDLMPLSAHKFYGPKGIGALYINPDVENLSPLLHGGKQQNGVRSGTLNVPGIIALGKAAEIAEKEMATETQRVRSLRDHLETSLLKIDAVFLHGHLEKRIHNTTNLCFPGVQSQQLLLALGNIAVSSGSACSSITNRPSHVLKAMGLADTYSLSAIRFSLGRFTTADEIDYTIEMVEKIVKKLRQ
ncbi:cysteine desulfurase [Sphingobacterium sp. SRCM116780]|uniref:cysteine desulfurase family protein n=1 Tax=Sphingobacterium sp. SRCM116780 TaxID=2907623 RepID=UPI001F40DF01|nr:cysteine desulfurase family protein [Sphingobacterium sp. SRCM116780]UIR56857.1 cysteine desulfurase [Sphingobacterium sp. SRCM116780]